MEASAHHSFSQKRSSVGITKDSSSIGNTSPERLLPNLRSPQSKFGLGFERVAKTSRIEILKTPYHVPQANAICERFLGSVRPECLDHLLILHEKQLQRVLNAYVRYFNRARPHQGIKQQIPEQKAGSAPEDHTCGKVLAFPILGGLHHDYRRSA
jgi:putative transposase